MPKFYIPAELAPGVQRNGIGIFKPGDVMEWPDASTEALAERGVEQKPSCRLVPMDEEGLELLQSYYPDRKYVIHGAGAQPPVDFVEEQLTVKEAAEKFGDPEPVPPKMAEEKEAPKKTSNKKKARASDAE